MKPPPSRTAVACAGVAVALAAVFLLATVPVMLREHFALGGDFGLYEDAARRWLGGGSFYLDRQLHGTYEITGGDILYPPVALLLFVPFTVLPAVLWFAIPLAIVAWTVVSLRPAPWTWPLLALCLCNPWSIQLTHSGNPTIWVAAFIALSVRWPWVAALVLLKPSLFPLALVGIRSRSWWVGVLVLGAVSLLLWPMTVQWLHVVFDGRGQYSGLLYSWTHAPLAATALVARLGSGFRQPVDADRARRDVARGHRELGRVERGSGDR